MDETIITYYYLDTNRTITESNPAKPITDENSQQFVWKSVDGLNYKSTFESERFKISHSNVKPLKLTYNILYDISGNPYNNLNIKNDNDISFNLYIFKPKKCQNNAKYSSYSFPINKTESNDLFTISETESTETLIINSDTFSNIYEEKIEGIFQNKIEYDISENTLYNNLENSKNFVLKPGKWFFAYDSSTNLIGRDIGEDVIPYFFFSSIDIPYIDFLYNNKKINMEMNNNNFEELFFTINNQELIDIRNHFSKYFVNIGKNDYNNDNNDYLRLFFDILLWTPENQNASGWSLPNDYMGINDNRIKEVPSYYLDDYQNEVLYTGYYDNEPGIRQDRVSYETSNFMINYIVGYVYYKIISTLNISSWDINKSLIDNHSGTVIDDGNDSWGSSSSTKIYESSSTWTNWNEASYIITKKPLINYLHSNVEQRIEFKYNFGVDRRVRFGIRFSNNDVTAINLGFEIRDDGSVLLSWMGSTGITFADDILHNMSIGEEKIFIIKITGNSLDVCYKESDSGNDIQFTGNISTELNEINEQYSSLDDKSIYGIIGMHGFIIDGKNDSFISNIKLVQLNHCNTIKDISDNIFPINDLSRNFLNDSSQRDISFVNVESYEIKGRIPTVDKFADIHNWEALLVCPSGVILQNGSRNILSSFSNSNDNSGFTLGIIGKGVYNSSDPSSSYIFKDVNGIIYPNVNNQINLSDYGVQFDLSSNNYVIKEEFNIRYKIRKNTNNYDVFIFINEHFVMKIENGGCKLNDINYWGTPYDADNPYKEYDRVFANVTNVSRTTTTYTDQYDSSNPYTPEANESVVSATYNDIYDSTDVNEAYISLDKLRTDSIITLNNESSGATITRDNSTANSWTTGYFMSKEYIERDDNNWQILSFSFSTTNTDSYIGITDYNSFIIGNYSDVTPLYKNLYYSFYYQGYGVTTPAVRVREDKIGQNTLTKHTEELLGNITNNSKWQIRIKGDVIKTFVIDDAGVEKELDTYDKTPIYPIYVAGIMYMSGASIDNMIVYSTSKKRTVNKFITINTNNSDGIMTLTNDIPEEGDLNNTGVSIKNNGGTSSWLDGYFISNEKIEKNDRIWQVLRFKFVDQDGIVDYPMFGLASNITSWNTEKYRSINYTFYLRNPNDIDTTITYAVYESGTPKVNNTNITLTDDMFWEIRVKGDVVKYYLINNGTEQEIYTSTQTPSFPLYVAGSYYHPNNIVRNIELYSIDNSEDLQYSVTINNGNDGVGNPYTDGIKFIDNSNTLVLLKSNNLGKMLSNEFIEINNNDWQYIRFKNEYVFSSTNNRSFLRNIGIKSVIANENYYFTLNSGINSNNEGFSKTTVSTGSQLDNWEDFTEFTGNEIYQIKVKGDEMVFSMIDSNGNENIKYTFTGLTNKYPLYFFAEMQIIPAITNLGFLTSDVKIHDVEMLIKRNILISNTALITVDTTTIEYKDTGLKIPKSNGIPRGVTTLLQSVESSYIEDIYRPYGLRDSSFINDVIYNDDDYRDICGNSIQEINITLNFNEHQHKQSTTTTNNLSFTDISVNPVNNYPVTLSYEMKNDTNITPHIDFIDDMINLSETKNNGERVLKDFSDPGYYQIEPLNYSKIFDAGEGRTLIINFSDFQFYHTRSNALDRLEIVCGDPDENGDIQWEKLKNNGENIVWMHNFKNTGNFHDVTPISDAGLRKNTEVANPQTPYHPVVDKISVWLNEYEPWQFKESARYQPPWSRYSRWSWVRYYRWYRSYYYYGGSYYYYYYRRYSWFKRPPSAVWNIIQHASRYTTVYSNASGTIASTDINSSSFTVGNEPVIKYYVTYTTSWWLGRYYRVWYRYEREKKFQETEIIKKTYSTHNYQPTQIQSPTLPSTEATGILLNNLGIRDARNSINSTLTNMSFKNYASPRNDGRYERNNVGVQHGNRGQISSTLTNDDLDINGSILPMNKERAIDIYNFVNNKQFTYSDNKNDNRLWKINTNKRYVRINYFAITSYTNCKFTIRIDRTLSDNERAELLYEWKSKQKIQYNQKLKGLLPVQLNQAYFNDLSGSQIESISKIVFPRELNNPISKFVNSNFNVFNNKEVPYISLFNYNLVDYKNDVILTSKIKKTILDDTNSYKYDDNRNLRELNLNNNPRLITPTSDNSHNKIGQVYKYNSKLFNKVRTEIVPYIPRILNTTFIKSSGVINFNISNLNKVQIIRNLINFWIGDNYETYINIYLYIWLPFSKYLGVNGGRENIDLDLNDGNIDSNLFKTKLDIDYDYLSVQPPLFSNNTILWKNNEEITDDNPETNHKNQFDFLYEIRFNSNGLYYGKNSVGFPTQQIFYTLNKFKGKFVFYWSYKVFQPNGIYNDLSPLKKMQTSGDDNIYNVNAQVFDTNLFVKDDFIYDPNAPLISWNNNDNEINISLADYEIANFKEFLNETSLFYQGIMDDDGNVLDISAVEINIYLWTPNNCKYDKILGENLNSGNTFGWELPNDYYGELDPRISLTPYKSDNLSWNPYFNSTSVDPSGTTHYGYNFDVSGTLKKTFIFKKRSELQFNIDEAISDISFNDISWNITKDDIYFNANDVQYNINDKIPNTLEYVKIDNITNLEHPVPYLTRWDYTVYSSSKSNYIESRVVRTEGAFGDETSFKIKFNFDPNYYFELNRTGMEGATSFRKLLKDNMNSGLKFGYRKGTNYLLMKVDGFIYQLYIETPPFNYAFFQLDENGSEILDVTGEPIKIKDNTIKFNDYNAGIKIDGYDIKLNAQSSEDKYSLYVRNSTPRERTFFSKLQKHSIVQMENKEITNRSSDWEPITGNSYYSSDNQYKYGVLFSNRINKVVTTKIKVIDEKLDPCRFVTPINHSSIEVFNRRMSYANRANLMSSSRRAVSRLIGAGVNPNTGTGGDC